MELPKNAICKICGLPIREDEIPASTGPDSFYHLHCIKPRKETTGFLIVDDELREYGSDCEKWFHAGWTWDGERGMWYKSIGPEEIQKARHLIASDAGIMILSRIIQQTIKRGLHEETI
jgi:hypothetical protein